MFSTQPSTANSLIKAIDVDCAFTTIFNKNPLQWKAAKKLRKNGKMTTSNCFGESFWNTVKQVKTILSASIVNSIMNPGISFLQHFNSFPGKPNELDLNDAKDKIQSAVPIVTKMTATEQTVRDNFYEAFHLMCLKYKMTEPIILYGRLFEEEQFQYVSFVFGKHLFVMEMATYIADVQERACETMCALIRKYGGLPKVSSFIKVQSNTALIVAEIDMETQSFTLCELVPDDTVILNVNEVTDLIIASHYLSNQPYSLIQEICAQTVFYKQPFLEGLYVNNKRVFAYVDPVDKKNCHSQYPIVLVFCDTITQSNFLWNDKPLTVTAKQLMSNVNYVTSKMLYQQVELLPMHVDSNSDECGGIRYGDQILYDGPLDIVLD